MRSFFCYTIRVLALFAAATVAAKIPPNVREFYDRVRSQGSCNNTLATGFHSFLDGPSGPNTLAYSYCGDRFDDNHVIYIQGINGKLANMDISCDGNIDGPGGTLCQNQRHNQTGFRNRAHAYEEQLPDLNPYVHPYVVLGNYGKTPGYPTFDPEDYMIKPYSLVAVVCNNKLVYGFWGDYNEPEEGQNEAYVGKASIAMGKLCYGDEINPERGHGNNDVLYIAFDGMMSVYGSWDGNWTAESPEEFEQSLELLGNRLIHRIGSGSSSMGGTVVDSYETVAFLTVLHAVLWLGFY